MNKNIYDLKLTNRQLEFILNISNMTIYRWREKGMPFEKDGGKIYYKLADVEKWLNDQGAINKTSLR